MELAERAVVRVFRDGEPFGIGVLVAADLVLTCAHLVGADEVEVDFPLLGERTTARVEYRSDELDVAGLRLAATPARARAVRVVAHDGIRDHRVRTFGVPANRPDGVWSQGVVRGAIAGGRIHIEDDRAHGLPMLQGFSGSPVIDDDLGAVVGMVVEVEARREHRIGYALSGAALHDAWPELAATAAQPSPFRGLEPFRPQDAEYFFGRGQRADELTGRLDRDGVLVVTGPSGCGKSSLVLAGLLPRLDAEKVVFRPATGSTPWAALSAALDVDVTPGHAEDALNRVLVRRAPSRLTVVVDQFDEALAQRPDEAADLLEELLEAVQTRTPRIDLVVTTTSDPLHRLLGDARFSAVAGYTATIGAPSTPELRDAVEGPLRQAGMPVLQEGLADALLDDLADERNPLPLLEFTLTLLWERQERGVLTHRAYRDLGGVAGAVSTYAEHISERFDPVELRRVLTQLVSPLESGGFVRRAVPPDRLGPIASELARTRLVTLGPSTVELVHEALVRHWARLRQWVEEDREFRLWQDEVERVTRRWVDTRERALLLRGKALRKAVEMAKEHEPTAEQRSFITASAAGNLRRIALRTLAIGMVISLTISLTYAVTRFIGQEGEVAADRAADALLGRGSSMPDRLVNTLRAFRTADRLDTRGLLRTWSRDLRFASVVLTGDAKLNPSGTRIARYAAENRSEIWDVTTDTPSTLDIPAAGERVWAGDDLLITNAGQGDVTVWDARTGRSVRELDADLVRADATGRWIAYGRLDATEVTLLDLQGGERKIPLPGKLFYNRQAPEGAVMLGGVLPTGEVVIHHEGKQSVAGGRDLPVETFEVVPGRPEPTVTRCADNVLRMTGFFSGATLAEVDTVANGCRSGEFSPDGRAVALLGNTELQPGLLRVGPIGDLRRVQAPRGTSVEHVVLEPSGVTRVVLDERGTAIVLRVPPPDDLDRALADAEEASFTPDGAHVVLLFADGRVEAWSREGRTRTGRIGERPRKAPSTSYAFSPDSRTLATREDVHRVTLWNLPDLAPLGGLTAPGPAPTEAEQAFAAPQFLDDHRLLVRRVHDVSVWEARTGKPAGTPFTVPAGPYGYPGLVGVDEDEIAALTPDKRLRRYTVATGLEVPGSDFALAEAADGPAPVAEEDGELLAVRQGRSVVIVDLVEHGEVDRLPVPDNVTVERLRFRDEDRLEITLAGNEPWDAAGGGTAVQLWERNLMWGAPRLLGRSDRRVTRLPDPAVPGYPNAGDEHGGLESGDPAEWVAALCGVVARSRFDQDDRDVPTGSFEGPVCREE
ncbi:WD40 repeat protein/energy-coupling factor transporter ATP-binding protein EcfA2 [Saccharothrix tamanrassetensis]|uniref:WD40 repeat protein/energy-coupling factor transporter ATP-binding protein EcfA2 n=1 Tax=Saccharothrix tamanrassetensis TaxID=1051531 RepID=A0A841CFJ8_9PSEU|nr:serine protease [Saccharothrix tamanrassetensis]MBB5955144.1 WD40 repeat protein/energy-coupling factor transporter ATP-binding protein EcfA2 [Saccharothrix tamanrassetensis]